MQLLWLSLIFQTITIQIVKLQHLMVTMTYNLMYMYTCHMHLPLSTEIKSVSKCQCEKLNFQNGGTKLVHRNDKRAQISCGHLQKLALAYTLVQGHTIIHTHMHHFIENIILWKSHYTVQVHVYQAKSITCKIHMVTYTITQAVQPLHT